MLMQRLQLLERNIAITDEQYQSAHLDRELKLAQINSDITQLYNEYSEYVKKYEDYTDIEKRLKVEIDYNLIRIVENKLKMDKEIYVMKKKLYERTMRMREL